MPSPQSALMKLLKTVPGIISTVMNETFSFINTTVCSLAPSSCTTLNSVPPMVMVARFIVHNNNYDSAVLGNRSSTFFFNLDLGSNFSDAVASEANTRAVGALRQDVYMRLSWLSWMVRPTLMFLQNAVHCYRDLPDPSAKPDLRGAFLMSLAGVLGAGRPPGTTG
jgi:hypothetical protein